MFPLLLYLQQCRKKNVFKKKKCQILALDMEICTGLFTNHSGSFYKLLFPAYFGRKNDPHLFRRSTGKRVRFAKKRVNNEKSKTS